MEHFTSDGLRSRQHGRDKPSKWHQENRREYSVQNRHSSATKYGESNLPRDGSGHSRSASRRHERQQPLKNNEHPRNEQSVESSKRSRAQQQENRIKRQNEREEERGTCGYDI